MLIARCFAKVDYALSTHPQCSARKVWAREDTKVGVSEDGYGGCPWIGAHTLLALGGLTIRKSTIYAVQSGKSNVCAKHSTDHGCQGALCHSAYNFQKTLFEILSRVGTILYSRGAPKSLFRSQDFGLNTTDHITANTHQRIITRSAPELAEVLLPVGERLNIWT